MRLLKLSKNSILTLLNEERFGAWQNLLVFIGGQFITPMLIRLPIAIGASFEVVSQGKSERRRLPWLTCKEPLALAFIGGSGKLNCILEANFLALPFYPRRSSLHEQLYC